MSVKDLFDNIINLHLYTKEWYKSFFLAGQPAGAAKNHLFPRLI